MRVIYIIKLKYELTFFYYIYNHNINLLPFKFLENLI